MPAKTCCCIFLFVCLTAHAQVADSVRTLHEVTVFGNGFGNYTTGSRLTRLDSTLLARYNTGSLSEVLALQLPLYFKNYGQNQLSSVAFRGTSSSQTNVLWNGFSLNSPTLGSSDFSVLPAFGVSQVEIQHGNGAALWGTGSIGGSILLTSRPVFGKGLQLNFQTETSRFGSHDFSIRPLKISYLSDAIQTRFSTPTLHFATALWQNHAGNDFPYRNTAVFGNPDTRQVNAAFRQQGFTQDLDWKFARTGLLSAKVYYTHTNRQAQPSMLEANQGNYRIDDSFRVMLSGQYQSRFGETTLKTAFFRDALNWNGASSPAKSLQTQWLHEIIFSTKGSVKAGVEVQVFEAELAGNYHRHEVRHAAFLLTRYQPFDPLTLTLNLRQAWVQGFDPPFTPQLGAEYRLYQSHKQQVVLKGNVGKGYRVPTLNDRYWIGGGNPDIRPENSFGYEGGALYRLTALHLLLTTEATYYHNHITDWIQWTPSGSQDVWSPRNLLAVKTAGLEVSEKISLSRKNTKFALQLQYYLTRSVYAASENPEDVGRQLEFTPLQSFQANGRFQGKYWFGNVNVTATGIRNTFGYTTVMPGYSLTNLLLGRSMKLGKIQSQLLFKCNNFFNTKYQSYAYYAMPSRSYSLSLRFQFNP